MKFLGMVMKNEQILFFQIHVEKSSPLNTNDKLLLKFLLERICL